MAKQAQFKDMEEDVPQELVDLARLYSKEQKAESKAKERTKQTKGAIIQKMIELKVQKFRLEVDGNMKWLTLENVERIVWEKSETAPEVSED